MLDIVDILLLVVVAYNLYAVPSVTPACAAVTATVVFVLACVTVVFPMSAASIAVTVFVVPDGTTQILPPPLLLVPTTLNPAAFSAMLIHVSPPAVLAAVIATVGFCVGNCVLPLFRTSLPAFVTAYTAQAAFTAHSVLSTFTPTGFLGSNLFSPPVMLPPRYKRQAFIATTNPLPSRMPQTALTSLIIQDFKRSILSIPMFYSLRLPVHRLAKTDLTTQIVSVPSIPSKVPCQVQDY